MDLIQLLLPGLGSNNKSRGWSQTRYSSSYKGGVKPQFQEVESGLILLLLSGWGQTTSPGVELDLIQLVLPGQGQTTNSGGGDETDPAHTTRIMLKNKSRWWSSTQSSSTYQGGVRSKPAPPAHSAGGGVNSLWFRLNQCVCCLGD